MTKLGNIKKFDKSLIKSFFDALPANAFIKDTDAKYVFCSQYWKNINVDTTDPNWTIEGKTDYDIRKDKENVEAAIEADRRIMETGIGEDYIIKVVNDDETITYMQLSKNPMFDENHNIIGIVGLIQDVTEKQEKRNTDKMTGLYNRDYYEYFKQYESENLINPYAVISIDLNYLKYINDKYGHSVGDEYIIRSANIIKTFTPRGAKVFRTGGDEFIIFTENATTDKVLEYITKIKDACKVVEIENNSISLSVGYSLCYSYVDDVNELIDEADQMMYADKEKYYESSKIKKRTL